MTGAETTVVSSPPLGGAGTDRSRPATTGDLLRRAQAFRTRALERKLVWVLGSPRSGTTWLMYLLREPRRVAALQEPLIGTHLGLFASSIVENAQEALSAGTRMRDIRDDDRYFFSDAHERAWAPPLRRLVLRGLAPHIPVRARYLVVQEPNGSEGADLLMRVLPRSRLLFLLRDGRDVVDSVVDAYRPGSWLDQAFGVGQELPATARLRLVQREAQRWVARTEVVARAYDRHAAELRLLVRYEDLLADTTGTLRSIYSWLRIEPPPDLAERVTGSSFESVPSSAKGSGKFHRAATPGLWRQNLSPEEQACCAEVMGPMLTAMGYGP
ncbi:MAG TPA: sulfotransferase [Acidimicrobiales bacterium]|nr:sulfotransferase [Acidimicrobiales bacterium]